MWEGHLIRWSSRAFGRTVIHSHITGWCERGVPTSPVWQDRTSSRTANIASSETSRHLLKWQERRHFILWKILKRVRPSVTICWWNHFPLLTPEENPSAVYDIWVQNKEQCMFLTFTVVYRACLVFIHLFSSSWKQNIYSQLMKYNFETFSH